MSKISTQPRRPTTPRSGCWIDEPEHIELLASAVRQEIIDSLDAAGPSSIRDLAREVGMPADALYYHVRKLLDAGLLIEEGTRQAGSREEVVYRLPCRRMRLRYDLADPQISAAIVRTVTSMLRVATRDFAAGMESDDAVVNGSYRNLRAVRFKAWLTKQQIKEVNQLLSRVDEIFQSGGRAGGRQLCALSWALAPVDAKPIRRET